MIIAIDGPAASGKGTLARRLAAHFGLPHLDTGLLYRAVGWTAFRTGQPPAEVASRLQTTDLGDPDLANRPEYTTGPDRSKNRKALNAEIGKFTEKKSSETWVKEFNAAGVPCGPIYSIDQVFADAQVEHLGMAQDVPNAEGRHIRLVGQPFTLSRTPSKMAARPPEFGEQTEEVLAEFGFSAEEINKLRQAKVV